MRSKLGFIGVILGVSGLICTIVFLLQVVTQYPIPYYMAYIGLALSIPAMISGGLGIKKDDSSGLAIAGLIIGSIGFMICVSFVYVSIVRIFNPYFAPG